MSKLVTNLAGNVLIVEEKYDVTYVKRPKNKHKFLSFASVIFIQLKAKFISFYLCFQKNYTGQILFEILNLTILTKP